MKNILLTLLMFVLSNEMIAQKIIYPATAKGQVSDDYFGTTVNDPYRWFEDDRSKETADWVSAENAVTQNYLSQIPYRESIKNRLTKIFNYEKFSAPRNRGAYTYYFRNSGLQNQAVMYREKTGSNAAAEVFLDPNTFSKDGTTSMGATNFSKDGSMLAYNISAGGSDWQSIVVIDAVSKRILDTIQDVKFSSAAWAGNKGFYYSTYDRPKEGSLLAGKTDRHKIYWHQLGTPQSTDKLIYGGEGDAVRYMGVGLSEDEKWLFLSLANATYGNAAYLKSAADPAAKWIPIATDMKNEVNVVDSDNEFVYLSTDRNAPTGKIVKAPLNNPGEANWVTVIDAKPEVLSASSAGGYIFASYLKDAITKVSQYDRKGKLVREIKLPGAGTASGFGGREEDKDLYFNYTSYISPSTIYKYNVNSGKTEIYKQPKVEFDPNNYESKQVFYTSKDGTKIPMMITHKKGLQMNGNNPTLLYAYGGFSINLTPAFSASNIILLENGGVYAVANLRGGGEYGEDWHVQGTKMKKQNVFDDFMAAADYLVNNNYTSRDMLAIRGGSNGGLLVGACITQDPGMCKVAIPQVGVMDMLRYHTFTAGAGWAYDYGTSADSKEMFDYIYKYSPVHNTRAASYPATMVTTADHDDRVVPAHSFKFAANLQENQRGENPVLIRITTKAGHGSGKSIKQVIDEESDIWSFMFWNFGMKNIKS